MTRLVLRRLGSAIPTLFVVVALSFFLMRLAPGGPFDSERALDPAILANLRRAYRLDRPLPEQFLAYLWNLLHGDLGPSLHWRDFSVNDLFARALPVSLQLGAEALTAALVLGLALGTWGAARRGLPDGVVTAASVASLALPSFVVAPLLQLVFGLVCRCLPVGGWGDGDWRHQILPVATLALPQTAVIARLTQAALRDALAQPHIRTLRAFGLPGSHILRRALRGALLPVLSYLGPAAAALLTGSIVVETIFGIPGIGRYFVDGALGRDYTLVMATVIVVAVMIVLFNLLVDIGYALIDPRIR